MRYRFGDFMLDTQRRELHHAGEPIRLRRKVFQVLVYLLAHHDRVVPKQGLLDHLWPVQFVEGATLSSCMKIKGRNRGETMANKIPCPPGAPARNSRVGSSSTATGKRRPEWCGDVPVGAP